MAQGYDRREGVQDPLAPQLGARKQAAQIQGSPVSAPRAPNLNGIGSGERAIASLLSQASGAVEQWNNRKIEQWQLEGEMAYASGKTEEEIRKDGNRYTAAGFMTMKARTAGIQFQQQALDEIGKTDKQLDPEAYQKKLGEQFKAMQAEVGSDEFTRNLMNAQVAEMFPKLVSQQVKSNNAWKEEETYNSYVGMLVAEGTKIDPTARQEDDATEKAELFKIESGLSPELQRKARLEATTMALSMGDKRLLTALGVDEKKQLAILDAGTGTMPAGMVSAVMYQESRGNQNAVSPKGAKGAMQVMDKTNADPGYGVVPAKDNSLDERDRVGRDYLVAMNREYPIPQLALMAYNAGPGAVNSHIESFGNPMTGEVSVEQFIASFPAKETREYVGSIMKKLPGNGQEGPVTQPQEEYAAVRSLLKQGYTPAEVTTLMNSMDKYEAERSQKFDKNRIMVEDQIATNAQTTGNLDLALDEIQQRKDEYGFSDAWANQQAGRARSGVQQYAVEQKKTFELDSAIATDTVSRLSGDAQGKAIERFRAQAVGELQAKGVDLHSEEGQEALYAKQRDFVIRNGVVDPVWKGTMNSSLQPFNIVDQQGKLKDESYRAYKDYLNFEKSGGIAYASRYLDKETQKLVALAQTYDENGLNSDQALQAAAMQLSQKNPVPVAAVPEKEVMVQINAELDRRDTGLIDSLFRGSATNFMDISDQEIAIAKNNPALKASLTMEAKRVLASSPNGQIKPDAAVRIAIQNVSQRAQLMPGGSVVIGDSKMLQAAGLSGGATNQLFKTAKDYLEENGKTLWGNAYTGRSRNADAQFAERAKMIPGASDGRGPIDKVVESTNWYPRMDWKYDPDRQVYTVDLMVPSKLNEDDLVPLNDPKTIRASDFGEFHTKQLLEKAKESADWNRTLKSGLIKITKN